MNNDYYASDSICHSRESPEGIPLGRESKYFLFTQQWMPTFVGMTIFYSN